MTDDTGSKDTLPENFFEELPIPTFWRLLVKPLEPKTKTASGLIVASTEDAQKYAMYLAEVLALGPFAGTSERLGGGGKAFQRASGFPEVGTFVIFGKYAGQRMKYKGVELAIINDDEILGVALNPEAFKIYI